MITKEQAILEAVRTVLAEPTRTNNGACRYLKDDGTPNCIASQVLFNLGVPTNVLELGDGFWNKRLKSCKHIDAYATDEAIEWLADLQFVADNGFKPGGDAWGHLVVDRQGTIMWAEALRMTVA